jgi:zinc transporter ZupT
MSNDGQLSYLTILLWLSAGLFALATVFTVLDHRWVLAAALLGAGAMVYLLLHRAIQKSNEADE